MAGRLVAAVAAVVASGLLAPGLAGAESPPAGTPRYVTFVARVCDSYTDITANLQRNNIQESLEDLGANSTYVRGQPISAAKEAADQPACRPLPESDPWRFRIGNSIAGQVEGTFGKLSVVGGQDGSAITAYDVPLLNSQGVPTGQTLDSAVVYKLSDAQLARAHNGGSLWVMGGQPAQPTLDHLYPSRYGFAALRCAIDNWNGDNVEWIAFPDTRPWTSHVLCYAYYVKPPPTAGTIAVWKRIDSPGQELSGTFNFGGTVSYVPGGTFSLTAKTSDKGEIEFVRAETQPGDDPWVVQELANPGWALSEGNPPTCNSADGTSSSEVEGAKALVTLGAGDTVTCIYVDRPATTASLVIKKVTLDDKGTFGFRVTTPSGAQQTFSVTTLKSGVPVAVDTGLTEAGRYIITEVLPDDGLEWVAVEVSCGGLKRSASRAAPTIAVDVAQGAAPVCTFTNRATRLGEIVVRTVTRGGTGSFSYVINPPTWTTDQPLFQDATTKAEDAPVTATGDSSEHLRYGSYRIRQLAQTTDTRPWALESVTCAQPGKPPARALKDETAAATTVSLGRDAPKATCTFVNVLQKEPPEPPVPPEPPTPPTPPTPPEPPTPPTPPDGGGSVPDQGKGETHPGGGTQVGGEVLAQEETLPGAGIDTGLGGEASPASIFGAVAPWSDAALFPTRAAARAAARGDRAPAFAAERFAAPGLRLQIPRLGLNTRLEALGLRANGSLAPPVSASQAGFWRGGARPGSRGAAVIAGHVDSLAGPGVFYGLSALRRGDTIVVRSGKRLVRYAVTTIERHSKWRFPTRRVYARTDVPTLRLVTCSGSFNARSGHYADNLIVFARRVPALSPLRT